MLLVVAIAGRGPSARAAALDGECTTMDGVTVVIDFQQLGGGVYVRCAEQPVGDGFAALRQAGIAYQNAVRVPGFLCRIAGLPADDPCVNSSPPNAYWSYWVASRGGSWCSSSFGAGNRTPPPGTVEGWSFAKGATGANVPPPSVGPPAPIPGTTPTPLGPSDCDSRSSGETTTTTSTPATTTTPAPAVPEPPAVPAGQVSDTEAPSGTDAPPNTPAATARPTATARPSAPTSTVPHSTVTTSSATTSTTTTTATTTTVETPTTTSTVAAPTTSSTSTSTSNNGASMTTTATSSTTTALPATSTSTRSTIDLGGNGPDDGGSAGLVWTGVGVSAVGAAGMRAAFVVRRRRSAEHDDDD